ncbi:MAG: hypothetical protein Q7T20_05565, partial [Saprospiraceae bacterium]|nr:hypothetical protein [Saprospiraceae bacterium]
MKNLFFPLACLLIAQLLPAQSPKWVNYANAGAIRDILPTNEYVWISSQGGLERIDRTTGARKIFQPSNSGLRGLGVSAVHPATNGDLWVSGNYGGLFRFDGEEDWEQFYTLNTGETLTNVEDLEITPEGNLWFIGNIEGSNAGYNLYQYDGVQFTEHMGVISPVLGNNW